MSKLLLTLSAGFFTASALIACSAHVGRVPVSGPAKPALPFPVFESSVVDLDARRVGAAVHVGGPQHALTLNRDDPEQRSRSEPDVFPTNDPDSLDFDELDQVTHTASD